MMIQRAVMCCSVATCLAGPGAPAQQEDEPDVSALVDRAVIDLIDMQESDGAWPYQGVYRVKGEIPVGYRVGGTAIVCQALLFGADAGDDAAHAAIERGVALVLKELDHPLMQPSTEDAYDVRVWGHLYALEFFCQLRAAGRMGEHGASIDEWIPRLVDTLIVEQLDDGGWNYASRRRHAAFVTAPAVQALLWARSQGADVPAEVFDRARDVLTSSRLDSGAYFYSGSSGNADRAKLPGSIARSAVCETTLRLLGAGSEDAVASAVQAFHEHWDALEVRRQKTGTHQPPYGVAPYYFYYGHRYAAQAVQMLDTEARAAEQARMVELLLRTRDENGTWNDRVFPRSRNYGTAMAIMLLLGEHMPLPPGLAAIE